MALSPAKSLGEKLHEAVCERAYPLLTGPWLDLSDRERTAYEQAAVAFAASLSFDEQTQAAIDLARAQGRASLEERVRLLEAGLRALKGTCSSFCDCDGDFVADQVTIRIDALLATPGERENG